MYGKDKVKNLSWEVKIGESKHSEKFLDIAGFGDRQVPSISHEETETLREARVTDEPKATELFDLRYLAWLYLSWLPV